MVSGIITKITIVSGGAGYTAPIVTITDTTNPLATGADATATIGGPLKSGIRKFVDSLPGLTPAGINDLGQYIPVAIADKTTYPGYDYYEIAVVQYSEKMHRDLPNTTLRGYVQIQKALGVPGGKNVFMKYPNGTAIMNRTAVPAAHVYAYDNPHYLGPIIVASKGTPIRVKFHDYLPTGTDGKLFIPVDKTVMGAGMGPLGMAVPPGTDMNYTENRATVHLHGGDTVWISDGTPHQWITPAGEHTAYPKGVSVRSVPDMDGGVEPQGTMTFYYTNNQSARLMFYHDHAYGITRLNVYAGEAAPYLLTDQVEQDLISGTNVSGANPGLLKVLPDAGIPLVIQDKAFIDNTTINGQDPTWNWGTGPRVAGKITKAMTGDLWIPHVFMPNQNPYDLSGANTFGRWDYAPWFWPPAGDLVHGPIANPYYTGGPGTAAPWEPPVMPATPNPSMAMEAFLDTPVVNGALYPNLTLEPKAYRFRILNAAGERYFNLQLYQSTPIIRNINVTAGGAGYTNPSVTITDRYGRGATAAATVVNGVITGINVLTVGSNYTAPVVTITGTNTTKATAVARVYKSNTEVGMVPAVATSGFPAGWPTDGRDGGVPDPAFMGPSFIRIGTEGGFLPAPVVVQNQPVTWIRDFLMFMFGIVDKHALQLGPAERADVIIDFSGYANKTLLLYNDAPAAFPNYDPRWDYYTGDSDQTDIGGAPTTQPGYGPNTRTIMQIKVLASAPAPAYSLTDLNSVFAKGPGAKRGVFEVSQPAIIVTQAAYNSAYNKTFTANISKEYVQLYQHSHTFQNLTGANLTIKLEPKAIHDEMGAAYEQDYGRMSSMLGLEVPNATTLTQNFMLLGYASPPVEVIKDSIVPLAAPAAGDGTQLWKIVHNGVDSHTYHFHLYNVQLVNRVGWDGVMVPPDLDELGWKETVRVDPLEQTIVALRPVAPKLPFKVPNSTRLIDPTMPAGVALRGPPLGGFFDPAGNGVTVTNHLVNFGWEYVLHCHLLGHEEMDMMHAQAFAVAPEAPSNLTAKPGGSVYLNWTDNSISETGFTIQRATNAAFTLGRREFTVGQHAGTGTVTYHDTTAVPGPKYYYRVLANNVVGDTTVYPAPSIGYPQMTANSTASNTATTGSWGSGQTTPGATNWQTLSSNVIYTDVNTAAAGFTATPRYFTSLGGTSNQRNAQGISAIYSPTATGFRLYLQGLNGVTVTPTYANTNGWYVQWLGVPTTETSSGQTTPGATNWQALSSNVIYTDVNTAAAGFTATPRYFTSLGGTNNQRNAQGISAIYSPTATGFRLYLQGTNGVVATPAQANSAGWYVQWLGMPTTATNSGSTVSGATNWLALNSNVIYTDVSTSTAGFAATPLYFTSLGGTNNQRNAQGISAIYSPTATGFRLYLQGMNGVVATPAYANSNGWNVRWLGVV